MPIWMIVAAPVLLWLVGSVAGACALALELFKVEATLALSSGTMVKLSV